MGLCVDEKTQIQVLDRTQPLPPIGLGYGKDVATGEVITSCKPRQRHQQVLGFLRQIEKSGPGSPASLTNKFFQTFSALASPKIRLTPQRTLLPSSDVASGGCSVPVLMMAWRRPDTTALIMERLQEVRPHSLFVACDGANCRDVELVDACLKTRQVIEQHLTWDCEVHRLYRDQHLGCRRGVAGALDWFFSHTDAGIILEDDVLPDQSFFPYCTELLERYRHDDRVAMISGCSIRNLPTRDHSSYRYSSYCHVWGWASWKRSWRNYDAEMTQWPAIRAERWLQDLGGRRFERFWRHEFDRVWRGDCDTWDYIWMMSCWRQGQVCVLPAVNLVENIGFADSRATHTALDCSPLPRPTAMEFPLRHPSHYFVDEQIDQLDLKRYYAPSLLPRTLRRLKRDSRRLWNALVHGG